MKTTAIVLSLVVCLPLVAQSTAWTDNGTSAVHTTWSVGIGTTAPVLPLHVHNSNAYLKLTNPTSGSAITDGFQLGAVGANVELWNWESGYLTFATGAAERMRIAPNGFVGIGTANPSTALHVHSSTAALRLSNSSSGAASADGFQFGLLPSGADGEIFNFENGYLRFATNAAEAMRITASGNVGIGATSAGERLTLQNGALAFNHPVNTVPYVGVDYDPTYDALRLRSNVGATTLNNTWLVMRRETGNIGIGTLVPGDKLSIVGGAMSFMHPTNQVPYVGVDYDPSTDALRFRTNYGALALNTTAMSITRDTGVVTIAATGATGTKLTVNGNVVATGSITGAQVINATYQDIAEWVPATTAMPAGMVVCLNPHAPNEVQPSGAAYDTSVAGVVSSQPGIILGVAGDGKLQIATTGRVRVRATAADGPIRIGDLLVTSGKAGMAMRSQPLEVGGARFHRPGTIIGKALEELPAGEGEILVLLSLQ